MRPCPVALGVWTLVSMLAATAVRGATTAQAVASGDAGSIAGRVFEVDRGLTIPVLIDPGGFSLFGSAATERILAAAVQAWQIPPLALAIVGTGDLHASPPFDPFAPIVITIGFVADASAAEPYCASGGFASAALGGGQPLAAYTQVFDGRGFLRQGPCQATLFYDPRDTTEACPGFQPCLFINVLAHELGHCLGFNHIAHPAIMADDAEPVCACAHPSALDLDQLRTIYPLAPPVYIATPPELPPAQVGVPYASQLQAAGGRPPYAWSIGTNAFGTPLPFPPALMLSEDGLLSGLFAEPTPGGYGLVLVVDAEGRSYKDLFHVPVVDSPPVTTTTTATTTSTLVIDVGEFPCITTTTTLPDPCSGTVGGACTLAVCRAQVITRRAGELPSRLAALARRIERRVATANAFIASDRPRRATRGRRAVGRALGAATRLARALTRPNVAARLAPEVLADVQDRLARLVDALHACRGS